MIRLLLASLLCTTALSGQDRTMAITVDDLPVSGGRWTGTEVDHLVTINRRMIEAFRDFRVPAVGFVNEERLGQDRHRPRRIGIFQDWLDAGLELGNHTYSHPDINNTPLEQFQQDVLMGERETRPLAEAARLPFRYFPVPFHAHGNHSGGA